MKTPSQYRNMEFVGLMIELAKLFKPEVYVELGVKKGYTLTQMAPLVGKAIGIDINPVYTNRWNIETIQCTTKEYAKSLEGKSEFIDMLFIDADHSKEAVLTDFVNFLPYVKQGTGLILMHDTHPVNLKLLVDGYCSNAWEAAVEIRKCVPQVEIVTLPGPWAGLSIVRKAWPYHLSWAEGTPDFVGVDKC